MYKTTFSMFLAVVVTTSVLFSPVAASYTQAAIITDQDINNQRETAYDSFRGAYEQYLRLLTYMVIAKLEFEIEAREA